MDFNVSNLSVNWKRILPIIVLVILLIGNIFFGTKYFATQMDLRQAREALEIQRVRGNVLGFTKMFIATVLKAKTEVDFETRLKLETAVRNLNDQEILAQWQKFVDSKAEIDAQENVKNLLEILVNKIQVQ